MTSTASRALVLTGALALAVLGLAACGSSSTSASSSAPASSAAPASDAPASDAPASEAAGAATYCEPLAAAYELKPASGEVASDEQLTAFANALEPAAIAAQADGRQDIADFFALIAQMNAAPDTMTAEQTDAAFTGLATFGPEIQATCGIDIMQ